ncbi:MAG: hypothetical protein EA409_11595 [Saprospirales bacterium]|nr:MAG: hypothetical protein EA409_11595 [Saprospirales bacterium]
MGKLVVYACIIFWTSLLCISCKEKICPDVCSEALHLESGIDCKCECVRGTTFNKLMRKWSDLRICIHEFIQEEEPYILLSHQADFLTCGRSDYLLLYLDTKPLLPHPAIPDAEQGFFRINFYGQLSRNLYGYTKYHDNDTLHIGHGLNPAVSNRSFFCSETSFHSGKLYFSEGNLIWEKMIYGSSVDWELETNAIGAYRLSFSLLEPIQ